MALSQWRNFSPGVKLPATWTDGIEKLLANYVSPNLHVHAFGGTVYLTAQSDGAGGTMTTGDAARALMIQGRPRWVEADLSVALSGASGYYSVYAVSSADSFSTDPGPPTFEVDNTDHSFTLKAYLDPAVPSGTGTEAIYRKVMRLYWDGTRVAWYEPLLRQDTADEIGATWRTIARASGFLSGGAAAGTYLLPINGQGSGGPLAVGSTSLTPEQYEYWFEPGDWGLTGGFGTSSAKKRATRLRVRARVICNTVAPGTPFTFEQRSVQTYVDGASGASTRISAVSAASSFSDEGSAPTAVIASPSAGTKITQEGNPYGAYGSGPYALCATTTSAIATGARVGMIVELQAQMHYR
jgi:hypothetical protein